ncbi:MAG: hypothetical protein JNL58_21650 [Planctomyces sp.]|nr:hypothetical protein [Planctomyces sp.]
MGQETVEAGSSGSQPSAASAETMFNKLIFGLSLPERLVRSAVGLTAGTAREIAEFVVPQAFQDSKTYEVMIRNSLGFLVSGVGTVSPDAGKAEVPAATDSGELKSEQGGGTAASGQPDPGRYIAKKAASNFIDIAGLATLHISPLWILAIVSDAAYGTKSYLNELAQELRDRGLIDETSTIHKVEDLMDAVRQASGTAASTFDQPPLSLDELQMSIEQTRLALLNVDPTDLIPEAEIASMWTEMREVAAQEQISLLGVSAAVAMQTMEAVRDVSEGTITGLLVAGKIVNRNIFGHYASALSGIRENGIWESVRKTYQPYVNMAWSNFMSSRRSWTEQVLDPGHITRAWTKLKGWFGGNPVSESAK